MAETPKLGALIRTLTEHEKAIRAKWAGRVREREVALQRAVQELQQAKEVLNDLALSFAGKEGPVVMTADGLYAPPEKDGAGIAAS